MTPEEIHALSQLEYEQYDATGESGWTLVSDAEWSAYERGDSLDWVDKSREETRDE